MNSPHALIEDKICRTCEVVVDVVGNVLVAVEYLVKLVQITERCVLGEARGRAHGVGGAGFSGGTPGVIQGLLYWR